MKVSVCVLTFNHERYLAEALDSILRQSRNNFELEVIVGDDMSSDGTLEIASAYARKYPVIRILQTEKKLGMEDNLRRVLERCDGDFVAFCDGDDYWTDELKLQNQLSLMINGSEFGACYHNVQVMKNGVLGNSVYPDRHPASINFKDLMSGGFMKTCALFIRNRPGLFSPILDKRMPADDTSLCFVALEDNYMGHYDNRTMAVYRVHDKGIWSMIQQEQKLKWAEASLRKYVHYYVGRYDVAPLEVQLKSTMRELSLLAFKNIKLKEGFYWLLNSFKSAK